MLLRAGVVVIGLMVMMTGADIDCYSEDGSEVIGPMTMQGNVTAIDWVGSVLTVNDTEFSVPSNMEVRKGAEKTTFSDIDIGDSVTVTYIKDKDGSLKATKVVIAYSGEMPI